MDPFTLLMGMQIGAATMETSMEFPQTINSRIPYNPAIPFLDICPKGMKSGSQRETCTPRSLQRYSR